MRHIRSALAVLAGATALVGYSTSARSADHGDSPAASANGSIGDINDVYAWMADSNNVVLAMTVGGFSAPTQFSNAVKYVFHTASATTFGGAAVTAIANGIDVIATFDTNQTLHLWVVNQATKTTLEYVTGNANVAAGLTSTDTNVQVFAGPRADPFFFNFAGFTNTVATVEGAAASLTFNDAGCPNVDPATSALLAGQLKTSTVDGGAPTNPFATNNVLGIVVKINKSLLTTGTQTLLSVWGATTN